MPPEDYQNYYEYYSSNEPEAVELRKTVLKENIAICKYEGGKIYTDEEIEKIVTDPAKLSNYRKANKYFNDKMAKEKILDDFSPKGVHAIILDQSMSRHGYVYMDLSGTQEANEKNRQYYEIFSNKDKAQNLFTKESNNILYFDFNKFADCRNDSDYFDLFDKDYRTMNSMFVYNSATDGANGAKFSKEGKEILKTIMGTIEAGGPIDSHITAMASSFYLTTPGNYDENFILPLSFRERMKNPEKYPGLPPNSEDNNHPNQKLIQSFNSTVNRTGEKIRNDFSAGLRYLRDDKKLNIKNIFIDFKAVDDNGNTLILSDAISKLGEDHNARGIKIVETTAKEKALIKQVLSAPYYGNKLEDILDRRLKQFEDEVDQRIIKPGQQYLNRGMNRVEKVRDEINVLCNNNREEYCGKPITKTERYYLALSAIKRLQEKNDARSGIWKYFYKTQNADEINAIQDLTAKVAASFGKTGAEVLIDMSIAISPTIDGIKPLKYEHPAVQNVPQQEANNINNENNGNPVENQQNVLNQDILHQDLEVLTSTDLNKVEQISQKVGNDLDAGFSLDKEGEEVDPIYDSIFNKN